MRFVWSLREEEERERSESDVGFGLKRVRAFGAREAAMAREVDEADMVGVDNVLGKEREKGLGLGVHTRCS